MDLYLSPQVRFPKMNLPWCHPMCRMLIQKTGKQIVDGRIDCAPYHMGQENGCTYCEYHGICGFDARMDGFAYRRLSDKADREEILARMEEDLQKDRYREERKEGEK